MKTEFSELLLTFGDRNLPIFGNFLKAGLASVGWVSNLTGENHQFQFKLVKTRSYLVLSKSQMEL
jgi:hypothetical protein